MKGNSKIKISCTILQIYKIECAIKLNKFACFSSFVFNIHCRNFNLINAKNGSSLCFNQDLYKTENEAI